MGLSASQARLLSITQRISNNELESEIIANSKMRLAEKNTIASEKYIAALDSTKMTYVSYDDTGIQETVALTFNTLNQYTPLKNQYGLYNPEDQLLVSQLDADNFAKSPDLYSFLDCYGLLAQGRNENEVAKAQYEAEMIQYEQDLIDYNNARSEYNNKSTPEWQDYLANKAAWEAAEEAAYIASPEYQNYLTGHQNWETLKNSGNTDQMFRDNIINGNSSNEGYCYNQAKTGNTECYLHLLNHLLDFDGSSIQSHTYQTSTGKTIITNTGTGSGVGGMGTCAFLKEISDTMNLKDANDEYIRLCDGNDDYQGNSDLEHKHNMLEGVNLSALSADEAEILKLRSDYCLNSDGTYSVKSIKQKAIDLYYLIKNYNGILNATDFADTLINFTEGDFILIVPDEPQPPERPNNPCPYSEPTFDYAYPTKPKEPVEQDKIYDKSLAQWYTNLWYAMDGQDKSDVLYSICDENADFNYYTVPNKNRTSTIDNFGNQINQYYQVIEDNLASDTNWIQFALNNGIITMKQAAIRMNGDITWAGIESSSTSDIYEVDDNTKIAKAEAEYTESIAQIQAEDKKFDAKIKKLDTEHTALQTEVESIKTVMSKNVENSFSVFS